MTAISDHAMSVGNVKESVPQLVSMGCKFVVEGPVYETLLHLVRKLQQESHPSADANAFLADLEQALIFTTVPVQAKLQKPEGPSPIIVGG